MARVDMAKAEVGIFSLHQDMTSPIPQFEFDLSHFRDPIGNAHLRKNCLDGTDPKVQTWIKEDPRLEAVKQNCLILAEDMIRHQGSKWLSIGLRDHHGKWISRAVVEIVADYLAANGFDVGVLHGSAV
jgi:hypothetical protein